MISLPMAEAALTDLAAAWRGWEPDATAEAILAATQAAWDFGRISAMVVELLRSGEDTGPADLRNAARKPIASREVPPEGTFVRGLAQARRAIGITDDGTGSAA